MAILRIRQKSTGLFYKNSAFRKLGWTYKDDKALEIGFLHVRGLKQEAIRKGGTGEEFELDNLEVVEYEEVEIGTRPIPYIRTEAEVNKAIADVMTEALRKLK